MPIEASLALPMLSFYMSLGRLDGPLRLLETMPAFEQIIRRFIARMIRREPTKYVALLLLFTFCQVIGSMCALVDLSMAEKGTALTALVEEHMVCPMDGTVMCPPSLTSSPERQSKQSVVVRDVTPATMLLSSGDGLTRLSASTQCSWSNVCSIVPLSIDSSPVLRI